MHQTQAVHGNLVKIAGTGVLIQGDPGSGKSRLSLALLDRGHQLIADDMVDIDSGLTGKCPSKLKNHLHLRHLGLLNVPYQYGAASICESAPIELLIKLDLKHQAQPAQLSPTFARIDFLGHKIPSILFNPDKEQQPALMLEVIVNYFFIQYKQTDQNSLRKDGIQ